MDEHFTKEGLLVVKPTENVGVATSEEEAKWKIIGGIIEDYAQIHPREIRDILRENKALSQSIGKAEGKHGLRWGCRMSPGLTRLIEIKFPEVFSDSKQFHAFMKRFPGFAVCEQV